MIHVGDAGTDRVEGFERADECSRQEDLDLDASSSRRLDGLREANSAWVEAGQTLRPIGHHLQVPDALRDRGCREAQGCGRRQRSRNRENVSSPHGFQPFPPGAKNGQRAEFDTDEAVTDQGFTLTICRNLCYCKVPLKL